MAWHVAIARTLSPFGRPESVQVVAVLILAAFAVTVVLYLLAWLFPRQPDSSEAEPEGASARAGSSSATVSVVPATGDGPVREPRPIQS